MLTDWSTTVMNTITETGNLTSDPVFAETKGDPYVRFTIAVDSFSPSGRKTHTSYFLVKAWGLLAEHARDTFTKGMRVIVTGSLSHRSFEEAGQRQDRVEIVATDLGPSLVFATAQVTKTNSKVEAA